MPVLTALYLINAVRAELNDDRTQKRYSDAQLLEYATAGQRALVQLIPESYARPIEYTFADTEVRQALPSASYYQVLRVDACLVTGGSPPLPAGRAIRTVQRDVLDTFYAAWPLDSGASAISSERYLAAATDDADPLAFWIFPQPVIGHAVQLTAVAVPPVLSSTSSTLALNDVYLPLLVQYVCYAALRNETRGESPLNSDKFIEAFGGLAASSRSVLRRAGPDRRRPPGAKQ